MKKAILLSSIGILLMYMFRKKNSATTRKPRLSSFVKEMVSEIKEPLNKTASEIPGPS